MNIGRPSLQIVIPIFVLTVPILFIAFVKLPVDFDDVHARRVYDFGADRAGEVTLYASGQTRHERLGLSRIISGPYRFEVCTGNATQQGLTLKAANLARAVEGQLLPVAAEFNIDRNGIVLVSDANNFCVKDLLSLDIEIDSDEVYCVDLILDLNENEKVERACLNLDHSISHYRLTLWDLFVGWAVYST